VVLLARRCVPDVHVVVVFETKVPLSNRVHLFEELWAYFSDDIELVFTRPAVPALFAYQPELLLRGLDDCMREWSAQLVEITIGACGLGCDHQVANVSQIDWREVQVHDLDTYGLDQSSGPEQGHESPTSPLKDTD
jgi:hypothetical protein